MTTNPERTDRNRALVFGVAAFILRAIGWAFALGLAVVACQLAL
jgi:hypothetical protein